MAKMTARKIRQTLTTLAADTVRTGQHQRRKLPNDRGLLESRVTSRKGATELEVKVTINVPGRTPAAAAKTFLDDPVARKAAIGEVARIIMEKIHDPKERRHGVPPVGRHGSRQRARSETLVEA